MLLGQGLTNDLAGLLVGVVADLLGGLAGLGQQLVGALLGHDQHLGDLALGGGQRRRDGLGRRSDGRSGSGGRSGRAGVLQARNLGLGGGKLGLGGVETTLEVGDLLEHGVDLDGDLLEEGVNLLGVITVLGGREGLLLDVYWCDCHSGSLSFELVRQSHV